MTLIGQRGVVKTIAQYDGAVGQGRADLLPDKLSAASVHQKQLGIGRDWIVTGGELDHISDGLADGSAAWLAKSKSLVPLLG